MNEIIIDFLNISKIKFIGIEELIELVRKYYPGLESKEENEKVDYIIKLSDKVLPKDIDIPNYAKYKNSFAGPHYFSWQDGEVNFAYSPPEERGGSHLVLKKNNLLQVNFHEGEPPNQIIGISREILIKEAIKKGYMPVHASAISKDGKGYMFFGDKNTGKSTALFSSVIHDNAKPISGDLSLVKKEDDGWQIIGWPWTVTIGQAFFDSMGMVPKYNIPNNGKVKFLPSDFCKELQTDWIWSQPLEQIINVDLKLRESPSITKLTSDELKLRLERYGRGAGWFWDDVFGVGVESPKYDYESLSKDVTGNYVRGDICQLYKSKKIDVEI